MRRITFFALSLAVSAAALVAQVMPPPPPPPVEKASPKAGAERSAGVLPKEEQGANKPADYSREPFIVEQMTTRMRFENDGSGRRDVTARIKVQSDAGVEQLGQLVWGYSSANERLDVNYVRVHKADGSVVTAAADAVQDLTAAVSREAPMYTDYHQKHVTVPALRPGETLEYSYTVTLESPLAPGQFWTEYNFWDTAIVRDEELEINVPGNRAIKLKTKPGHDPKITEENGRRIYSWTASHLTRDDDDAFSPLSHNKNKKKKKRAEEYEPDVQLTTFENWDEVGRWYADLERPRRAVTPDIDAKTKALIAGRTTDLDKIEALYDYVAKNFRYVSLSFGTGRYQPHAAADVFANQYGDCKDKNTLLAAMLKAAGYNSNSVLIGSSHKLDPDVPSPAQFDHVITQVPVGNDVIWLDTTTEVAPFRQLAYPLWHKQALVVMQKGESRLEDTPSEGPLHNTDVIEADGKVNELGKLTLHQKETLRGDLELALRMIFRRAPETQWKRILEYGAAMNGIQGEITDYKVSDPADTHNPFQVEMTISLPNFVDWTKKKSELSLPVGSPTLPEFDEDAVDPLKLGSKTDVEATLKIEFPAKYTLRAPLPISVKRDYAEYSADYKVEGHTLIATRKYVTHVDELPAARVSDYNAFRRAVLADGAQKLGIEGDVVEAGAVPAGVSADDLAEAAGGAASAQNYPLAIDLYKRVVELDPKYKMAWAGLGFAYQSMGQYENAISAYRKQLDANPYDEWTWNSLGLALSAARKYDESETAFKKLLEINPLDKFGLRNLGNLYLEQHKYAEAAVQLEKAASVSPDNATVQLNLGRAYLNLGDNKKALAAFDQAVQLSSTPTIWNGVAYEMSLKKVELDRALQYAESAVSSTSTMLRNMSLGSNEMQQLGLVSSLGASWDTLGWVYFQRGDTAKAEKYLAAAWDLSQNGEVGDHLGQLYEKLGQKDKAIRAYALSMASTRPFDETRPRLAALLGGDAKVDAAVDKARSELTKLRSYAVTNPTKEKADAEFYVVLTPSGVDTSSVDDVRFISGNEKLKTAAQNLRALHYNFAFPDDTPTRIVRRGVLSCTGAAECSFVLSGADDPFSGSDDEKKLAKNGDKQ
jgi:tetratricopeptide (TPR) repeat protein/transglutaminase-like putative cysteine protease